MPFAPAPLDLSDVLDATWLSAALSAGGAAVEVAGFQVVETIGPSALKVRLVLDYASPPPADLPAELCIKGVFDPALAAWLSSGAQQAEALFYRDIAPTLSVRVPRCFYAGYDPATRAGLVIMEDLVPQGARFLSAMSPYTLDQVAQSLDQLARLHGESWSRDPAEMPWAASKLPYLASAPSVSPTRLTELMTGPRGHALPDAIRSGERIYAAMAALARRDAAGEGLSLVHGDCHAGNVWQDAAGRVGLIDWQVLQRSHWSIDVAYHVAAVLDVEARRASEQDLLAQYLDRLEAHGGPRLDFSKAWQAYRTAAVYGLFMWGITQRVEPEIVARFVTRLGSAVADHASFEGLGV